MKHPKYILKVGAFLGLAAIAASCGRDPNDPGIQYAPEMYESIPYEPFKQVRDSITPFANHLTMQIPPDGTVPRGGYLEGFEFGPGDTVRTSEGVVNFVNPIAKTPEVMKEGEVLYVRFCAACHGTSGAGNGPVTQNPAIKPQAYSSDLLKGYTDGQIYHTIMYGKNAMGSYTSQVQHDDRWKIVHFVRTLQGTSETASDSAAVDSGAVMNPVPNDADGADKGSKGKGK
jgi:mono/diheme cytochrome c family protein